MITVNNIKDIDTNPRNCIINFLQNNCHTAFTMEEILCAMPKTDNGEPICSFATVRSTICDLGLSGFPVRRVYIRGKGYFYYDTSARDDCCY